MKLKIKTSDRRITRRRNFWAEKCNMHWLASPVFTPYSNLPHV